MNKEEVKFDHFKDIEELIQHLEMWYAEDDYYAYDRYFHLRDARIMGMFIYELQQENKKYKEVIDKATKNEEEIMYLANKVAITTQNVEIKAVRDRLEEIFKILKGDSNE